MRTLSVLQVIAQRANQAPQVLPHPSTTYCYKWPIGRSKRIRRVARGQTVPLIVFARLRMEPQGPKGQHFSDRRQPQERKDTFGNRESGESACGRFRIEDQRRVHGSATCKFQFDKVQSKGVTSNCQRRAGDDQQQSLSNQPDQSGTRKTRLNMTDEEQHVWSSEYH